MLIIFLLAQVLRVCRDVRHGIRGRIHRIYPRELGHALVHILLRYDWHPAHPLHILENQISLVGAHIFLYARGSEPLTLALAVAKTRDYDVLRKGEANYR